MTKATIARALSKGLVVRVTGASGTVRLSARISAGTAKRAKLGRKARTVASGAGAAHDGAATVRLRFSRSTAKALRRLKTVPLTIRVTGGSATAAVTLRR